MFNATYSCPQYSGFYLSEGEDPMALNRRITIKKKCPGGSLTQPSQLMPTKDMPSFPKVYSANDM